MPQVMEMTVDDPQHEQPSPELARDLGVLTRSPVEVPSSVDDAMLAAIRSHFQERPRRRPWLSALRLAPWGAAAAAMITVMVVLTRNPEATRTRDLDRNGRVDILDAFALARWIESGQPLDVTMDFNGDGAVDRLDADDIAMHAVSLEQGAS
jgi:hypothetical protein